MTVDQDKIIRLQIATKRKSLLRQVLKERRTQKLISEKVNLFLIKEEEEKKPHSSTGVNVLEDVLKVIIPSLRSDYQKLTTNEEQRKSFRVHILNQVNDIFERVDLVSENKINFDVSTDDDQVSLDDIDKFIEVEDGSSKEEEIPEDEFLINPEESEDERTGREFSQETFKKIEKQIKAAYIKLSSSDKEIFQKYMISNLKLYFEQFEENMSSLEIEKTIEEA